ncbi:MAG TPA: VOC family protein [Bacteroidales bacterium]|nr:VOC family protein [Bacteroidales bacterium]
MKRITILFLFLNLLISCHTTHTKTDEIKDNNYAAGNVNSADDTIPKVTGIGGIFFFSDDPSKLREWYAVNLGLAVNEWGSSFEFRNANRPEEINYLQWSPFKKGHEYFAPSTREFMINYRVQNIEGLVTRLKAKGVTVVDTIERYEYGKFVHIMDMEGNKIELWEPVDSVLTKMGGPTTK